MARTQIRLDALTGSLVSSESAIATLNASSLQDVMDHLASGIKRLHGGTAYHTQEAGLFSQDIHIAANLDVDSDLNVDGAAVVDGNMHVSGTFVVESAAQMDSTLAVEGNADLNGQLDVAGLVALGAPGGGSDTTVRGDLAVDEVLTVTGNADLNGQLDVAGAVALGAAGGSADTQVRGDLSVAEDATIAGDLTVTGDFRVNGSLTYVDTTNLLVKDAKIVISSGSLVDGAGIYLANEDAGENIRWDAADTKWIASDKLAADTLQALDLSEAIVWADASGNLVELSAADFGAYLSAGAGIDSVANGQIDATPYVAGTGVTISNFTASIGQDVATGSLVEFAGITDSSLTAFRLMAADGSNRHVSAELYNFVQGTAKQILVASGAGGDIELSLPQNIDIDSAPQFEMVQYGGSDYFVSSSADGLILHAGPSGDSILFQYDGGKSISLGTESLVGFTATDIMGALNELKSVAGSFFKLSLEPGAVGPGTAVTVSGLDHSISDADKRIDVFVNGQLLRKTADYGYDAGAVTDLTFTFGLEPDDVLTVISR
jgi:cytoskeletal protein CcmA (bactofilin family)